MSTNTYFASALSMDDAEEILSTMRLNVPDGDRIVSWEIIPVNHQYRIALVTETEQLELFN